LLYKRKRTLSAGARNINDCHLLEEVFIAEEKERSTKDWMDLAESNIFRMLFDQGCRKKEDPTIALCLAMSNSGFNLANFIVEV